MYKPEEDPREFTIDIVEEGYRVQGKAIERAANMTYWEHDEFSPAVSKIDEHPGC